MDGITEIFYYISLIAEKNNVRNIGKLDGLWKCKVDEDWEFRVNGHDEEIDGIPPYYALIVYRGLPAGLVNPFGGTIAAGQVVNEDVFIEAMKKTMEE